MVYGLLNRRVREKVPRTCFHMFGDLLSQARQVEDLSEESYSSAHTKSTPSSAPKTQSVPSTSGISAPAATVEVKRRHCGY
jgi:hypothetical protein